LTTNLKKPKTAVFFKKVTLQQAQRYRSRPQKHSGIVPVPHRVRDKLQPESKFLILWIPDQVRNDNMVTLQQARELKLLKVKPPDLI